jgi:hypothetical protein
MFWMQDYKLLSTIPGPLNSTFQAAVEIAANPLSAGRKA